MKYAYIKYGNVVEELSQIGPQPGTVPESGPMTFLANFLKVVGDNPALVISWDNSISSFEKKIKGNIEANTYRRPVGFMKFSLGTQIFLKLIRFRPDIVLCVHDGPGLWAGFFACLILGKKLIHSRQRAIMVPGDKWHRRFTALIDGFVIRKSAGIICHGPFTMHQLKMKGVSENKIIEFDVKFDSFLEFQLKHNKDKNISNTHNKFEIFYLGRMESSKGVFELLQACMPILKSKEDVFLTFIGEGSALGSLRDYVNNKKMGSKIFFTGNIPHNDVSLKLITAYLLVTPTRRGLEGWGMAALEGLAMGIPVVAPNAGPFPFMIQDGFNGLLFKPDSVEDMRIKIEMLINDPPLRDRLSVGAKEATLKRKNEKIPDFGSALQLAISRCLTKK